MAAESWSPATLPTGLSQTEDTLFGRGSKTKLVWQGFLVGPRSFERALTQLFVDP